MIQSKRLKFYQVNKDDLQALHSIYSCPLLTKYFASGPDLTLGQSQVRLNKIVSHWQDYGYGDFLVYDGSDLIGFGGLHKKTPEGNINIAYIIKEEHWHKGYGKELSHVLLTYGFQDLKLQAIYAEIDPDNLASIKLIEKLGFEHTQTLCYQGYKRLEYKKNRR